MITKAGSSGIDEFGNEYDHSFAIKAAGTGDAKSDLVFARVSYSPTEDGSYEAIFKTSLTEDNDKEIVETRVMTLEDLQKWFDNPTIDYYESTIKPLPVK